MNGNSMHTPRDRRNAVRVLTAAVGLAAAAGLATPALAVGEGTIFICNGASTTFPMCPWYEGEGPILSQVLDDPMIFGSRAVIGMVSGLLPPVRFEGEPVTQVDHEAFRAMDGTSRVIVGVIAGAYGNGRSATDTPTQAELVLQRQAGGVLATALGNGDALLGNPGPSTTIPAGDTTQGVAPLARAIVSSVAGSISGSNDAPQFETELSGFTNSMLIMADPAVAQQFADAYPDTNGDGVPDVVIADVIIVDVAEGGDLAGEGFIPRVADGIVFDFDVCVVAPTGDDADAPVPVEDRQQFIFNRSLYAPASGYNVIAVGGEDLPPGATNDNGSCLREYSSSWFESGRGYLRARNYGQADPDSPVGFQEIAGARVGPTVVAPATKLRIPDPSAANAYVRPLNLCELLEPPGTGGPVGDPPPDDLGKSTRYAAGYVAGSIALVQDAYKQLHEERPGTFRHARVPALSMNALLMNSARRSNFVSCWTNQSDFYEGDEGENVQPLGNCEPYDADVTQQSLDSSIGAGLLNAAALHENFQGRAQNDDTGDLLQLATMDVPTTLRDRPLVRLPPSGALSVLGGAGFGGGGGPSGGFGDVDPPLGGPSRPPNIGDPGTVPPNWPIRILRPRSNRNFENPSTLFINSAIPVSSIGWDIARLGLGYIDYVITSIISAGDTFSVTLAFNRLQRIDWPNVQAGETLPLDIRDAEVDIEYEDINLLLFTADSSGNPQAQIGRSATEWDNRELVYFNASIEDGPGGMPITGRYLMRVEWEERKYDRFLRLFAADTEFGLAWRQEPVEQLGGGPGGLFAPMAGDVNIDGVVDMADMNAVLQNFGQMNFNADANSDGIVNFADLSLVLANFGRTGESLASAR